MLNDFFNKPMNQLLQLQVQLIFVQWIIDFWEMLKYFPKIV